MGILFSGGHIIFRWAYYFQVGILILDGHIISCEHIDSRWAGISFQVDILILDGHIISGGHIICRLDINAAVRETGLSWHHAIPIKWLSKTSWTSWQYSTNRLKEAPYVGPIMTRSVCLWTTDVNCSLLSRDKHSIKLENGWFDRKWKYFNWLNSAVGLFSS